MEGTAWDARRAPPARVAARTAQQPGLILAAAWVGGSVEGCPCRFFGDHRGAEGGVWGGAWGRWLQDGQERQVTLVRGEGVGVRCPARGMPWERSKPWGRVGCLGRCIVPRASAERGGQAVAFTNTQLDKLIR
jgi:hypothetical protein